MSLSIAEIARLAYFHDDSPVGWWADGGVQEETLEEIDENLFALGLIDEVGCPGLTEKGAMFLQALKAVPLPVRGPEWVMP